MVADFGFLKKLLVEIIDQQYDHTLMLWRRDPLYRSSGFRRAMMDEGCLIRDLPIIPTAEELARFWFRELEVAFQNQFVVGEIADGTYLQSLIVHETPNCKAEVTSDGPDSS